MVSLLLCASSLLLAPPVAPPRLSSVPRCSAADDLLEQITAGDEAALARALRVTPELSHDEWLLSGRTAREANQWRAAATVARAALRAAPEAPLLGLGEHMPVRALFADAIGACADAGAWRDGGYLLREFEASGREVGSMLYTEAARACWAGGEWSAAVSLVRRARRNERGECTVGVFAHAIAACESAGQIDEAMELYALGVEDGVFRHWHASEPFSVDLHGFTQSTATCAVRYVLTHEVGNFLAGDLKIITGAGKHAADGESRLGPRIERLLSDELSPPLPYDRAERLHCDHTGCTYIPNDGCLVVPIQELFRWLLSSKPFESYYINLPAPGTA